MPAARAPRLSRERIGVPAVAAQDPPRTLESPRVVAVVGQNNRLSPLSAATR
jgi:hypothetical protein